MSKAYTITVAADVGGTFTDVVAFGAEGELFTRKVPSTPGRYAEAILTALHEMALAGELPLTAVAKFLHGTTIATNSVLEGTGARVALLTTRGFSDVLEIGRLRMPTLYEIDYEKPPSLVERQRRLELEERVDADGSIHARLDPHEVVERVTEAVNGGAQALAVCLLNSYLNPTHEQLVKDTAQRVAPGLFLSVSSEILPELGEYERTSTTAINAYLGPVVTQYIEDLCRLLEEAGIPASVGIMQSSGGTMPARLAAQRPAYIVESGPAAGVVGAQTFGQRAGRNDLISFDMGGTTAKACVIEDGEPAWVSEFEVGGPISLGARLMRAGGYVIRLPALDIAEVGAGGGSVVRVDSGGSIQVGPQSAGALPGPVAYDSGGMKPTITDASILLGYLNPSSLAGGRVKLNAGKAREVFKKTIADPLGLAVEDAAYAVFIVANSNMIRAINAVSIERGRDPRRFDLLAFGGGGPLHAAAIAVELGIKAVMVPPAPGLFSASGLLFTRTSHRASRTFLRLLTPAAAKDIEEGFSALEAQVMAEATEISVVSSHLLSRYAQLRYKGQSYALTIPAPPRISRRNLGRLIEAFEAEYLKTYGHVPTGDEVEITTLVAVETVASDAPIIRAFHDEAPIADGGARMAYFGTDLGWIRTPVIRRLAVTHAPTPGPLIIEEYDATTLVPPSHMVRQDAHGNLILETAHG